MNELAQNLQGARIETHPQTRELAIYKFRTPGGPGAPGKVVGPNRMHLHVPPTTPIEDFQRLVNHVAGRYKMIQVDEQRRPILGAEAFYLDIMDTEPARGEGDDQGDVLRELVRANSRMVEVVADRFAGMMDSAARLISAADGAGLPAREPMLATAVAQQVAAPTPPPAEEAPPPASPLQTMIATTLGQAGPLIQHLILTRVLGLSPEVASKMIAGQLATVPSATTEAGASAPSTAPPPPANGNGAAPSSATSSPAAPRVGVDPNDMTAYLVHLSTIENLLSKRDAVIARELLSSMTAEQTAMWRSRVCSMSAADAANAIRAEIAAVGAQKAKTGGAS